MAQLADLEYFHLNKELNERLVNSRINKVYQINENLFKFNFNTEEGKLSLLVSLPDYLTISNRTVISPDKPSAYVMNLRKYLDNSRVISISQPQLERILIFNLYAQGSEIKLIFEMFSKGNILLVNSDNKILFTYRREAWKDREVKRGVEYVLPPSKKSCFDIDESDFELKGKNTIMAGILSTVSLAPKYLEYIILEENENPKSKEISSESISKLIERIKGLSEINEFYTYGDELSVIKMDRGKENEKKYNRISEAIDSVFNPIVQKTEVKKENKSEKVKEHISRQLEENKIELDKTIKKAEFIYENYNKVEYVLNYVNSLIDKGKSEDEINKLLEKSNMKVDLKEKKVIIKVVI